MATQALPQYRQVAETLRRRILSGQYREGDTIPPVTELERIFDVSNITIRKALGVLANDGWTTGRRGVGTVVNPPPQGQRVEIEVSGNNREWHDTASATSHPIKQEVLDVRRETAPPAVATALGRSPDEAVWSMRRLRRLKGTPISYHVNYGPVEIFGGIGKRTMAGNRNFVDVMRRNCGLNLCRMDQTVEATVADRDLAALLQVSFGAPLYFVENRYVAEKDNVAAVTHLFLRGDRYIYRASIPLDG